MSENQLNKAVAKELLQAIRELQFLPAFSKFAVAGGTGLAIRYNHRRSVDVDLFTNLVVGLDGLAAMQRELEKYYQEKLLFCEISVY